ncbi:MAG TPA: methyltransferase domain-containing protein [Roseiflexaceae bacterium]|nr:methyltransferase domain-containing protein [Roseiflexaceae bacterium]
MYAEALPHMRCPACCGALRLSHPAHDAGREIVGGALLCEGCGAAYPVRDGIADFLGPPRPPSLTQRINELPAAAWVYERAWRPFALTLLARQRFPYRRELPLMVALARPERGGLFLDVACSNGLYARALTRAARRSPGVPPLHVIGVDHALPMLREARRLARLAGLRITYVRAKAQALPVASCAASGVTIGGSLNEIGDLDDCLAEVRRTLAPGGCFVAMTLMRAGTPAGRALQAGMRWAGVVFWTAEELAGHFERHGLETSHREQHGIVLFSLSVPHGA